MTEKALPVGFDLKRMLAIHVLGWTPIEPDSDFSDWTLPNGETIGYWSYSDYDLAWSWDGMKMVVQAMHDDGWNFELSKEPRYEEWYATFERYKRMGDYDTHTAGGVEAPLAVGYAALKAKGRL